MPTVRSFGHQEPRTKKSAKTNISTRGNEIKRQPANYNDKYTRQYERMETSTLNFYVCRVLIAFIEYIKEQKTGARRTGHHFHVIIDS